MGWLNLQLTALCQCSELEELYLQKAGLRSGDLSSICELVHLKELGLWGNAGIDDAAVPLLCRLSGLQVLDLSGTGLTRDGIARLQAVLPQCNIVGP